MRRSCWLAVALCAACTSNGDAPTMGSSTDGSYDGEAGWIDVAIPPP